MYFAVKDKERNKTINEEIEGILLDKDEAAVLIVNDFNGRTELQRTQEIYENSRMILEQMEKYRLILLNEDQKCRGVHTWSRNERKSVKNYAMMTEKGYDKFQGMIIDEKKEIFDLSDHVTSIDGGNSYGEEKIQGQRVAD